jgi:hypothetical protein
VYILREDDQRGERPSSILRPEYSRGGFIAGALDS